MYILLFTRIYIHCFFLYCTIILFVAYCLSRRITNILMYILYGHVITVQHFVINQIMTNYLTTNQYEEEEEEE